MTEHEEDSNRLLLLQLLPNNLSNDVFRKPNLNDPTNIRDVVDYKYTQYVTSLY